MKIRDVIRMLEQDGWYLDRTRGSHRQYKHPSKPGLVTVPGKPGDELATGTLDPEQRIETGGSKEMKKYLVAIETTGTGYSAYSPDLPGCIATGRTREEVQREMQEAIEFHLEAMARDGETIPEPHTYSHYVEISAR